MNRIKIAAFVSLAAVVLATPVPPAESQTTQTQSQPPPASSDVPVYKPPLRGAPGGRVGGGTRGPAAREVFVLSALAPNHTGLTVSEQPSLYWFISGPTSFPMEVTVVDPRASQPVLEARVLSPNQSGVRRIRLADHNIRLSPGVAYRWFVAVVPDPARRSRDILAGGTIERVELSDEIKGKIAQATKQDLPFVYAEAGLWYDALAAISERIEEGPNDAGLRKQRAALMAQVGLPDIGE